MDSGVEGGLRGALGRLGAAALTLLRTRGELAALEFSEHRDRARAWFILAGVAALSFAFAAMGASALVVVIFWDDHRVAALVGVTAFYLLVGLVALWRIDVKRQTDPPPFAATLAELERDREWLATRARGGK